MRSKCMYCTQAYGLEKMHAADAGTLETADAAGQQRKSRWWWAEGCCARRRTGRAPATRSPARAAPACCGLRGVPTSPRKGELKAQPRLACMRNLAGERRSSAVIGHRPCSVSVKRLLRTPATARSLRAMHVAIAAGSDPHAPVRRSCAAGTPSRDLVTRLPLASRLSKLADAPSESRGLWAKCGASLWRLR